MPDTDRHLPQTTSADPRPGNAEMALRSPGSPATDGSNTRRPSAGSAGSALPDTLIQDLATVVRNTPGVLRLEPTLKDTVRQLRSRQRANSDPQNRQPGPTDGIKVTSDAATINVIIDIAVLNAASALHTARAVQSAAMVALQIALTQTATVTVNVLSIEAPDH